MEVTETITNIQKKQIKVNNRSIIVEYCSHNCKLSYLSGINYFLTCDKTKVKEDKQSFDEILKKCRIAVYLNTNSIYIKDFIMNNYELYSLSEIPIGYSGGYQYHIIIRNSIGVPNANMRPTEFNKTKRIELEDVKNVMLKVLKLNKRKTDIVPKVLAEL